MTSKMNRLFQRMLSNKGYTIDQTILIVAIIAILITLVIVTVGWQLINRTSGTKAGAQLKQIEDANGQFFSSHRVWPSNAQPSTVTPTPTQNMAALVNNDVASSAWNASVRQAELRNLLPGFKITGTGLATAVYHNFGSSANATVQQQVNTVSSLGSDRRLVIQFRDVPLADAEEADEAVDGAKDARQGRVFYGTTACMNNTFGGPASLPSAQPTDSTVYLCYGANTVQ